MTDPNILDPDVPLMQHQESRDSYGRVPNSRDGSRGGSGSGKRVDLSNVDDNIVLEPKGLQLRNETTFNKNIDCERVRTERTVPYRNRTVPYRKRTVPYHTRYVQGRGMETYLPGSVARFGPISQSIF